MADVAHPAYEHHRDDRAYDRANETTYLAAVLRRTSWGAIVAGVVATISVQMILSVLGVALGLTATEIGADAGNRIRNGIPVMAAVWWLVSGILSLLIGGCVVGRFTGITRGPDVLLHAFTMWAVTALFGFLIVASGAGALYGSTVNTTYAGQEYGLHAERDNAADTSISANDPARATPAGETRVSDEDIQRYARTASWWTLFGLVLGIAASLGGAWMTAPNRIVVKPPSARA